MATEKQLRIKINSIKRLSKEEDHYDKEISQLETDIDMMTNNNPNDYDIKKKKEFLEETLNTIKRTRSLRIKFIKELQNIVNENLESGDISSELIDEINCL